MTNHNPLNKYYRTPKLSVLLPSRGLYYEPGAVVDTESGEEINILPMTAQDEVMLKNPDALLSGEAVVSLMRSCAPQIRQPKKLLSCDVDAIMVGIRAASYGDQNEISADCPKCSANNSYTVDFSALLETVEPLESSYEVVLSSGVSLTVVPASFENTVKQQKALFEGSKIQRLLSDDSVSDEARLRMFSEALTRITKMSFDMTVNSVSQAMFTDDNGETVTVTDRKHIAEFLRNIDTTDANTLEKTIAAVNSHGVQDQLDCVCRNCGHNWSIPIEFNDTNFS